MSLDIWIYGPGFGESIFLVWDGLDRGTKAKKRQAAIIDCFGGLCQVDHPGLVQWNKEGQPEVVLAAITHPHLDHINGAGTMIRKLIQEEKLKKVLWWGGHCLRRTHDVYLLAKENAKGAEPRGAARMTVDFLDELVGFKDNQTKGLNAPQIDEGYQLSLAYSGETSNGAIKFHAISPWKGAQTEYTQWVDAKVRSEPRKGVANATSMGFLIEFGSAQILLGGDAENANWDECWKALTTDVEHKNKLPPLVPCLIKVSHHGSKQAAFPECGIRVSSAQWKKVGRHLCVSSLPGATGGTGYPNQTWLRKFLRQVATFGKPLLLTRRPVLMAPQIPWVHLFI